MSGTPRKRLGRPDSGVSCLEVHEAATQYFQATCSHPEAARAREYIAGRGAQPGGRQALPHRYAPESWSDMRDRLLKFFPEDVLRASGLFHSKPTEDGSPGPMYPHFRKRIMFPISSESGKPIAFTGRLLDTSDPKAGGKYVELPETPLYTKGHVLFNLDKAKAAIKETNSVVLVEGQMDCISAFLAGVANVIATSGTKFTEHQVRLLSRFTQRVVLNFDGDDPGIEATEAVLAPLVEEGFEVGVTILPVCADPDSFLRSHGTQEYMQALRANIPWTEFLLDRAQHKIGTRTPELRVKALNYLLPHLRRIPKLQSLPILDNLVSCDD